MGWDGMGWERLLKSCLVLHMNSVVTIFCSYKEKTGQPQFLNKLSSNVV